MYLFSYTYLYIQRHVYVEFEEGNFHISAVNQPALCANTIYLPCLHTPQYIAGIILWYPYTEVKPCSVSILKTCSSTIRGCPQVVFKLYLTWLNTIQVSYHCIQYVRNEISNYGNIS